MKKADGIIVKALVDALRFYADKDRYEEGSDWIWDGEDERRISTSPPITEDEGKTARDVLAKLGFSLDKED